LHENPEKGRALLGPFCFLTGESLIMTKTSPYADVFRTSANAPKNKADATDFAVRCMLEEEAALRAANLKKQRAARLAKEADAPQPAPAKKPVTRRPAFRKVPG
jgi:hypothetical protein